MSIFLASQLMPIRVNTEHILVFQCEANFLFGQPLAFKRLQGRSPLERHGRLELACES